jgi:hypothetical protein
MALVGPVVNRRSPVVAAEDRLSSDKEAAAVLLADTGWLQVRLGTILDCTVEGLT